MAIKFSSEEQNILISVLTSHIADLREEIHRTEDYTYRMNLKHHKTVLEQILNSILGQKELVGESVDGQ